MIPLEVVVFASCPGWGSIWGQESIARNREGGKGSAPIKVSMLAKCKCERDCQLLEG